METERAREIGEARNAQTRAAQRALCHLLFLPLSYGALASMLTRVPYLIRMRYGTRVSMDA